MKNLLGGKVSGFDQAASAHKVLPFPREAARGVQAFFIG